jgi:AhpD family alkylhydroperoxidase
VNESIKELIAIGASVGAHCQPCLEYHIQAAIELGVDPSDIRQAIEVGHKVEKGAMVAMKKFSDAALENLSVAAHVKKPLENPSELGQKNSMMVLKVYDPAMCCSSGVCGPSVDPVLAQFAGTLQFLAQQTDVTIERYNLGQSPQAFVANAEVKSLLNDGGEKRLPFIYINDKLAFQSRYPSRAELVQALGIQEGGAISLNTAPSSKDACCGEGGCC